MNYKMKNRSFMLLGVILIIIAVLASAVFAQENTLNNIDVRFEKEYYSTIEDNITNIEFEVFNNNNYEVDLIVYIDCENDEDLECDYYKEFNLSKNSSRTGSFNVISNDEGSHEINLYVLNKNENSSNELEFSVDLDIDEDNDEGEFEVEFNNTLLCKNKTNRIIVEIDNTYESGLYYLSFEESPLSIHLDQTNPVYLPKDEKEIEFIVTLPQNYDPEYSVSTNFTIKNDDVSITKEVSFSFRDCSALEIDFVVSGSNYEWYTIEKEEPFSLYYNIINNSNRNKHIYIAEISNNDLDIIIPDREVDIAPNSSKQIEVIAIANKELNSGDYDVNYSFFDGVNSRFRRVKYMVEAEHNISTRLLQTGTIALKIGTPKEILLVVENKGDITEDFEINTNISNDIDVSISDDSFRVNPRSEKVIRFTLSAGSNTLEKRTNFYINVQGENSNYNQNYNLEVLSFREIPPVTLDFLSIPQTISIDLNSSVDFEIEVFNFYEKDLVLESIEIRNLPQELTYVLPQDVLIEGKTNKIISGTLISNLSEPQEIDASIAFISKEGGVIERPLHIKVGVFEEDFEDDDDVEKSGLTAFLNLKNSVLGGIILVCLTIILLFITKVIRKAPLRAHY